MLFLLSVLSLFASAEVDLRKHDATISLSPRECLLPEAVAVGLGRVQSAVKLQGRSLQVNECVGEAVRVSLVEASGQPLKAKQKARQMKYLHRIMTQEGFVESPEKTWRLSR